MSNAASNNPYRGESTQVELTSAQIDFIQHEASRLDGITDKDLLKQFTETWWNLCQWEKQRLDVLDTKAQMLLGLSGLATAILGTGFARQPDMLPAAAAFFFLLTMGGALFALRVRNVGGFVDREVFGALSAATVPVGMTPPFTDKDTYACYCRETALQRWLVYDLYKKACSAKSSWVKRSQYVAVVAVAVAAVAVILPAARHQLENTTVACTGSNSSAPSSRAAAASQAIPCRVPTSPTNPQPGRS